MTWFLDRIQEKLPGLTAPLPSGLEQFTGAVKDAFIRTDAWARKSGFETDLQREMEAALGGPEAAKPRTPEEFRLFLNPATRADFYLGRARDVIRMAPEAWGTLPQDRGQFDREIERRRAAERDENAEMLARGDSPLLQLGGQIVGAMTDETSLAFLAAGGSLAKGFGRFVASEAFWGAASEVPAVIKEREVAKDLGFEPGNAAAQIATGAVFGGAFGALIGGGARAIEFLRTRNAGEAAAVSGLDDAIDTNAAEDALRRGDEPPPPNWDAIRNGIFAGESGGDYNALFGYTNRPGGPFADVKLTEMTVDEAIAFSDPSGPYAQWVKGRINRIATPMGAYQVVGTTLRAAVKGLGLKGDELMTPALQDRIGQWIYRQQGTGAWEGYAGPRDSFQGDTSAPYRGVAGGATARRGPVVFDEVTTPAGRRVPVQYRVVDLSELKPATGDLQPRDRSRAASDDQVTKIAAQLDPARLMPGPESDRGAPVIGRDGIIESGNGRVQALARAAEQNPQAYEGYVEAIRQAGFDVPEGVKRPVLVAERTDSPTFEDRRAFIRESNTSSTARMSATEQAGVDADYLTGPVFDAYQPGRRIGGAENAGFVRRMLGHMTAEERGALLTADGALNAEGFRRIRGALFARAFGSDDLLKLAVETENRAVINLIRMLEDLAPDWAAFRAMVEAGYVRPGFDITDQLMDAVRLIAKARTEDRDGQSVIAAIRDRLAQGNMFAAPDPLTEALVDVFYRGDRARSPEVSGDILARYAGKAAAVGRADTADLVEAVTPEAALRRAILEEERGLPAEALPARAAPEPDPAPAEVAAIDPAPLTDGTASQAVQRADDVLEADLRSWAATDAGADLARLSAEDPAYRAALAAQEEVAPTTGIKGYGTEAFAQQRVYRRADGSELLGSQAAVDYLTDEARTLAWREDGLSPEPIRAERLATIVIGPPASGKSSVANPLARARGAAIVDADEAKKLIPEYGRGEGVSAVHEESSDLSAEALDALLAGGENVVLPKVGANPASIERTIDALRGEGYRVELIEVVTPAPEAIARMMARGQATGRFIPPKIMAEGIDGAPRTYQLLKEKGLADAYARIDNAPARGQPRGILEDEAQILASLADRDGGDRGVGAGAGNRAQEGPQGGGRVADAADQSLDDMRAALDQGATITLNKGAEAETTVTVGDILNNIEAEANLENALQACRIGGGRA